ncbi:uncharacterized protein ACBT57_005799 [Dama dama]
MLSAAGASACGFRSPRFPSGRGGRPGVRLRDSRSPGAAVRGGRAGAGRSRPVCQRGLAAEAEGRSVSAASRLRLRAGLSARPRRSGPLYQRGLAAEAEGRAVSAA